MTELDPWMATFIAAGHDPVTGEDGEPDEFRYAVCYCNGAECQRCGWCGCMHCVPKAFIPRCEPVEASDAR